MYSAQRKNKNVWFKEIKNKEIGVMQILTKCIRNIMNDDVKEMWEEIFVTYFNRFPDHSEISWVDICTHQTLEVSK
jgi:hypothetical protein